MNLLASLIKEKALTYGKFKLASGQESNYYIDMSKVIMHYDGLHEIRDRFVELDFNDNQDYDSIGGPAVGAIPLVTPLMLDLGIDRSFFVRKETKEYGKHDLIEGNLQKGDSVLMVEDVVTTGGSLLKAIKAVEEAGGIVNKVYAILDREMGAKETLAGYNFISLLKLSDLNIKVDAK